MRWSALGWSKLVIASAIGAICTLPAGFAQAEADAAGNGEMPAQQQTLGDMFDSRAEHNEESAGVQSQIDEISDATDDYLAKYRTALKQIDSIGVYNRQLRNLIESQDGELASLQDQLDRVEEVGRSVTPLMLRMIDAFEATVELDLPFLMEERTERVAELRKVMTRAAVSTSEKYRLIMEAYQIENDFGRTIEAYQTENEYGRTIEAYRSSLVHDGREVKVNFLRFGRIALIYQSLDGREAGVWNQQTKSWDRLDASYRTAIRQGLRIARKQAAPDLIRLPLPVPAGGDS